MSEEIRSVKDGLDVIAAALDCGNLWNYTDEQLFEEIEKVSGMSDASCMKVYQVLTKEVSDARAYRAFLLNVVVFGCLFWIIFDA